MAEIIRYIKHRRDTAALWTANNPILKLGQWGIETDGLLTIPKFKIGNGVTAWTGLPYASSGGALSGLTSGQVNFSTSATTISDDSNFLWDNTNKRLQVGSGTSQFPGTPRINLITTGQNSLTLVGTNTTPASIQGFGLYEDTASGLFFTIVRQNSAAVGDYTGTTIARAGTTRLTAGNQTVTTLPIVLQGYPVYAFAGSTGTTLGFKQDQQGLRVDQIQNLHTANVYGFELNGTIKIVTGTPGIGKVLADDGAGNGVVVWSTPAAGSGTVTSVAWTTSQGVSASIANATTTPNITITLGALTGITSLNGLVITANTGVVTTGTWSATAIAAAKGGTAIDTSGSTGVAQVSAGTWSVSSALANGVTATTQSASDNSTKVATTAYVDAGDALKAGRSTKTYMIASGSPADSTSYLVCDNPIAAINVTEAVRRFKFAYAGTLKEASLNLNQVVNGTGETVTVYLRNITTATDNLIGTFTSDFGASTTGGFVFTGLSIAINTSDYYSVKILTPAWATNPTSWSGGGSLLIL